MMSVYMKSHQIQVIIALELTILNVIYDIVAINEFIFFSLNKMPTGCVVSVGNNKKPSLLCLFSQIAS